jgi:hypothetical protein
MITIDIMAAFSVETRRAAPATEAPYALTGVEKEACVVISRRVHPAISSARDTLRRIVLTFPAGRINGVQESVFVKTPCLTSKP